MRWLGVLFLIWFTAIPATAHAVAAQEAQLNDSADVETLIRILENDQARSRLIERLRGANGNHADEHASVAAAPTIADKIVGYARGAVEDSADLVGSLITLGAKARDLFSGAATVDFHRLWDPIRSIFLVVASTFGAYYLLRLALRRAQRLLAQRATESDFLRRIGIIGLVGGADILTVLVAWAFGYFTALYFGADTGRSQTLFLNAFFYIELAKVAARLLLTPRWPALRLVGIDDMAAAYWYFWLSRLVSVVGYMFVFAAPLLAEHVSPGAGEALRVVTLFCALAMAWIIIMQNRAPVYAFLVQCMDRGADEPMVKALGAVARLWHVVAIGYLMLMFLLWLANREGALPFVLIATLQSIIAVAVGLVLTRLIVRFTASGMRLPSDIKGRLPLLEQRLQAFVPSVLKLVCGIIFAGVALAIAQVWRLADFVGWISSEFGQRVVTSVVAAVFIMLVAGLVHLAMQSWVEYRLNPPIGRVPSPRERTLLALLRNAFNIALSVVVLLLVLAALGINIGPLLAGVGIIGLAVGFGSQKLVQDVINGAFIQFENAMNQGDVVSLGGITGTVERLTIRSVSLRGADGGYHLIPFSSVESVTNLARNFSHHVAEMSIDYSVDITQAKAAMLEAFERLKQTEHGENIIDELDMQGVAAFRASDVVLRARIKTLPGKQWALGRAYNELTKLVFNERGIWRLASTPHR
ncbi:mechanosensitive ion channel domain-containing protein [Phyllobacterium ifriqiyense]|uniref:mechanosensitive ion channel domain-containing protein n=1 Tax=Phyllobacterium ifriqiyense TaxID=314238 RepID=UPI00339296B2